jgi:hypothetical protein
MVQLHHETPRTRHFATANKDAAAARPDAAVSALENAGVVAYQSNLVYVPTISPFGRHGIMTQPAALSVPHRDFFISRSSVDAAFAHWIGQLIAAQGKTYIDQGEHFGHDDFMNAMHWTCPAFVER